MNIDNYGEVLIEDLSHLDDQKWEGLDKLDVGSKFIMFEKAAEDREVTY